VTQSSFQAPIADLEARAPSRLEHGDAVRDMFGRIAPTYDLLNRVMSGGLDAAWRKRAIDALAGAPRGASLDLCAGTLDLTVLLDRARPHQRLIASDFSEPMLLLGKSKVPRAEIVVADAQALPFSDASIAAVVCGFGIRNVADPEKALREIRRVMMPGGVFVTLEFFRPTRVPTRVFHSLYASVLLPTVGGLLSGDRGAYAYLARSMDGFYSRAEYERAVAQAGFAKVTGEDLTLGVASLIRAEVAA
jgi:ubiquinone/menaquinone biosynthesis methyltransferase